MKRVITAVVTIGLICISIFILKDKVMVSTIERQKVVHPSEDVLNQFGKLTVNGFSWISEDIHWVGDETLTFSGKRTTEKSGSYYFDVNTLEVYEKKSENHLDNEIILYEDNERTVYTDRVHDGLFIKIGDNVKELLPNQPYGKSEELVLSKNKKKLGFLDKEKKRYMTFDTISGKTSTMTYKKGEFESLSSTDQIQLSNDGGFISFEEKYESLTNNNFSILGADSGKYYGKNIKGIRPTFSPDSKKVAFIYTGEINQPQKDRKIGLFVLKFKKIIYLDTLIQDENFYPLLGWSNDSVNIYVITESADKTIKLNIINTKEGSCSAIVLPINHEVTEIKEIKIANNHAYIVMNDGILVSVDLDSGRYNFYDGLQIMPNDSYLHQISEEDFLVYTNNEVWVISNTGHVLVSNYEGDVRGIYLTANNTKVALLIENNDQIYLQVNTIARTL